jgi:hypothetical protein
MSYVGVDKNPINIRRKNYIINGNFDIWQRAITQNSSGVLSDDRWNSTRSGGTTITQYQQPFQNGQTAVPNNPQYYSRTTVVSGTATNSTSQKFQKIENVLLSSGVMFTLSFYAKADTNKNIAVDFWQNFGTGGTPSADVSGIGVTTFNLTTAWQKFTKTVKYPSITGKTLGTGGNDGFGLSFWYSAGSTLNSRTNTLGLQNGSFDISQIQLEVGSSATSFEYRPLGMELLLCQRYYEEKTISIVQKISAAASFSGAPPIYSYYKNRKVLVPTVTFFTSSTKTTPGLLVNNTTTVTTGYTTSTTKESLAVWGGSALTTLGDYLSGYVTIDAEI